MSSEESSLADDTSTNEARTDSTNEVTRRTYAMRRRRNPAVLIRWIEEHPYNPYPTKAEKHYLAFYAGMTQRQLNDWFANARRNIKKVGYEAWKKKHSGFSAVLSGIPVQGPTIPLIQNNTAAASPFTSSGCNPLTYKTRSAVVGSGPSTSVTGSAYMQNGVIPVSMLSGSALTLSSIGDSNSLMAKPTNRNGHMPTTPAVQAYYNTFKPIQMANLSYTPYASSNMGSSSAIEGSPPAVQQAQQTLTGMSVPWTTQSVSHSPTNSLASPGPVEQYKVDSSCPSATVDCSCSQYQPISVSSNAMTAMDAHSNINIETSISPESSASTQLDISSSDPKQWNPTPAGCNENSDYPNSLISASEMPSTSDLSASKATIQWNGWCGTLQMLPHMSTVVEKSMPETEHRVVDENNYYNDSVSVSPRYSTQV